jgi:hypothetical protein
MTSAAFIVLQAPSPMSAPKARSRLTTTIAVAATAATPNSLG